MAATGALISLATSQLRYLAKIKAIIIDNWAFTLHYRFAFPLILLLSVFVTCNQFFGEPIACVKSSSLQLKIINNYCWIEGTFILPHALLREIENESLNYTAPLVAPGIDNRKSDQDEILTQNYYYWVSLVLFFQSIAFYGTHFIWKNWEDGQLKKFIRDLNKCILSEETRQKNETAVANLLKRNLGKNRYDTYAFKFMFCEGLNVIHVLLQIKLTDLFLQGEFINYGWNMLFATEYDVNPTGRVFPKLTKCQFNHFGPSGDVQKYDNLCLLPLNILNEKIYFFIWMLFAVLLIVSVIAFFYRLCVILLPGARFILLEFYNRDVEEKYFLEILDICSYGDWFVLYLLSRNLDPMHYRDVVCLLANNLSDRNTLPVSYSKASTLRKQ